MGAYLGQTVGSVKERRACIELCGCCKWWASKYRVRIELVCGMTSGAQGECWVASDTELVVNKNYVSGYNSFFSACREKLQQFLESSTLYQAPELLSQMQDTDMHMECAILYGRVGR